MLGYSASTAWFLELAASASIAPDTLASCTEEALHTIQATSVLISHRLCLALTALTSIAVIKFGSGAATWVLQASTVVAAESLLAVAPLVALRDRLDLCLQRVIDALTLVDGVQALRARDRLHGKVGTHRHTLMNMTGRGQ